jgi:transcriptional regulator with XRE-family HTH domain
MDQKQLITHFGGTQKLTADALGFRQGTISKWRNGIPYPQQCVIEKLTNGVLKAERQLLNVKAK